jgi:hypothetical protein
VGRLTSVGTGPALQTDIRTLNYVNGRLEDATAINDRLVAGVCTRFKIFQDFSYSPIHGRLGSQVTSLFQQAASSTQYVALEQFSQSQEYDAAGRTTQVTYPCLAPCTGGARTVTTTYEMGRPTAVTGFASSIGYNDNGTLARIDHANGVRFTPRADHERAGSRRAPGIERSAGALRVSWGSEPRSVAPRSWWAHASRPSPRRRASRFRRRLTWPSGRWRSGR